MQTKEMIIQLVLPPCFPSQSKLKKREKAGIGATVWELNVANKNRTEQDIVLLVCLQVGVFYLFIFNDFF